MANTLTPTSVPADDVLDALLQQWPDTAADVAAPAECATAGEVGDGSEGCVELDLPHDATAPAAARRVLRTLCDGCRVAAGIRDDAQLVTSELVANAVEHATGPVHLHLSHHEAGHQLRIAVTDHGPKAHATPRPHGEHGRGLAIVTTLTDAHGTTHHANGTTTHWAHLPTT